jgi:short-subunit dehydrogenase
MSWALIAGGSKGIGFSIAVALAERKYNVILIARNDQELRSSKIKIENAYPVKAEILSCDLSLPETANAILDWCTAKEFDINILCNAAGIGGSKDFPYLPLTDLRTMIRLNLESPITLSSTLIPLLKKNAPSYILNIGSMAGFAPLPIKNVYASTKAALHSFSYSLRCLLKEDNISVSCLCPGPVFTKPSIEQETVKQLGRVGKWMAFDAARVGELAVQGMFLHKMIIVPGKLATLFSFFLRVLPYKLLTNIFYSFSKQKMKHSSTPELTTTIEP